MNVAGIHNCRHGFLSGAAYHNALWHGFVTDGGGVTFLRLTAPFLRREGNVLIDSSEEKKPLPTAKLKNKPADEKGGDANGET